MLFFQLLCRAEYESMMMMMMSSCSVVTKVIKIMLILFSVGGSVEEKTGMKSRITRIENHRIHLQCAWVSRPHLIFF